MQNLSVQGQTHLSSKGKLPYPLPISPKINREIKHTGFSSSKVILYLHLINYNSSIFKVIFLLSFWGYPILPSQDIRVCLWILSVQRQSRLSSKGKLSYPLPIFPKINHEIKHTGFSSPKVILDLHLNPLYSFIFKVFFLQFHQIETTL